MKSTVAITTSCCISPDTKCNGKDCMAWLFSKEDDEGQCVWMVTANMVIKGLTILVNPGMGRRIV